MDLVATRSCLQPPFYNRGAMRKKELTEKLAQQTKQTDSAAADALDDAITGIIKNLKSPRHRQQPKPNALERLIQEAASRRDAKGRCAKS